MRPDASYTISFHDAMPVDLDMNPERFQQVAKKTSEMDIKEILNNIRTIEGEGYSATQYRVDFHAKIAFPFVCVILVLAGVGIACKNQLKDGLPAGIAYGIGLAFSILGSEQFLHFTGLRGNAAAGYCRLGDKRRFSVFRHRHADACGADLTGIP